MKGTIFLWFAFIKRANLQQWANMSPFFQSANTPVNRECLSLDLPFTIMVTCTNLAIFLLTAQYANKQKGTFSWKMEKTECEMHPVGYHSVFFGIGYLVISPPTTGPIAFSTHQSWSLLCLHTKRQLRYLTQPVSHEQKFKLRLS